MAKGGNPVAEYGCKSGVDFSKLAPIHGGMPPKKGVEEIDKVNMPKNAPDSFAPGGKK